MHLSSPDLPPFRIPAWERRRGPDRFRWNGKRRNDPRLPPWMTALADRRTLAFALGGCLLGLALLLLTGPL